jgi:hypothetical protein
MSWDEKGWIEVPDYPRVTMSDPEEHRRTPRVWPWIGALVALAVLAPLLALMLRDAPDAEGDDRSVGTVAGAPSTQATTQATTQPTVEPTVEPTASTVPDPERANPRALFFGDSYFVGAAYTDESNSMARIAGNRLGWAAEVNGAAGVGFVHALPEFGVPNYLGLIDGGAFDVGARRWVVIEGGGNDTFEPLDEVNRNARKIIRIAQRRFPGATIALMGPMDSDGDFTETTPVVKVLRKAANRRGIPFINANRWMVGHYDLIGPDGIHPYPKGHRIAARKLAKALRRLGA